MNICIQTSTFPASLNDHVQIPFLFDFIEGLKRRGHRIFIYTQDRKGSQEGFLEGIEVKRFFWIKSEKPLVHLRPFHPLDFFRIMTVFHYGKKLLPPFLREKRVDACLALWIFPSGYFAYHAYRQTGIPYSVWALGSDIYQYGNNPFLHPLMRRIIEGAKGVFADGFDLSRRVEEKFGRPCSFLASTRRLLAKEPDKGAGRNRPEGSSPFLFVGRLEKVKGIDLLLEAMALLKGEMGHVHLTVVGRGSMEEGSKQFVKKKGLENHITFLGHVKDESLAHLYLTSHCLVIPSRSESIPVVFSEALHFNLPMIVTDVGDMGTLGREYGAAWVVPPEDPVALKEMMKKRIESGNPQEDQEKRLELKRLFDIETSVDRFLADYEKELK